MVITRSLSVSFFQLLGIFNFCSISSPHPPFSSRPHTHRIITDLDMVSLHRQRKMLFDGRESNRPVELLFIQCPARGASTRASAAAESYISRILVFSLGRYTTVYVLVVNAHRDCMCVLRIKQLKQTYQPYVFRGAVLCSFFHGMSVDRRSFKRLG